MAIKAFRSSILHFNNVGEAEYFDDGILVVENDQVKQVGHADDILESVQDKDLTVYDNKMIMPGFIDTHIHYPQVDVIASYGEQLLDWLNNYTFPTEIQFEDPEFAKETAEFFLDELLKNGTTTALVFGTKHKQSVDAFFEASSQRNTRMICGKVMMNRNAPDDLLFLVFLK